MLLLLAIVTLTGSPFYSREGGGPRLTVTFAAPFVPAPYDSDCHEDWGVGEVFENRKERVEECWKRGKVVHFLNFKCYSLHSQGPCKEGERIVYTKAVCPTTTCRIYTDSLGDSCPGTTVSFDGSCRDPTDPACGSVPGQRLMADIWGDYACRCSSALGFLEVEGSCWPRYLQGPCGEGEQVARGQQGEGVCRPDPCVAFTTNTSKRGFFLGPGGVCHHLTYIYSKFALPNATVLFTQDEISLVKGDARFQKPWEDETALRVPNCSATHCTCKHKARTTGECLQIGVQDANRFDEEVDFLKEIDFLFTPTVVKNISETILIEFENYSELSIVESENEYVFEEYN